MITTKAPGKLYIAGEYAVVETGQPSIIAAVSQYLYVTIATSQSACGSVYSTQNPDFILRWHRQQEKFTVIDSMNPYHLVTHAIQCSETYAKQNGYWNNDLYDLSISSELDDPTTQTKFGLGSSGAVVVATIQAILLYHGVPYTPMIIYKLGALTLTQLGSNGSFGDIAASTFGGMIAYKRPSFEWIQSRLQTESMKTIVDTQWPFLSIEPISLPTELTFVAGWTRTKADTTDFVRAVKDTLNETEKQAFYSHFLEKNASILTSLITACQLNQPDAFQLGISQNRDLLREFSSIMNVPIETPPLEKLCEIALAHHASAKTSGAGGGDCGICFTMTDIQTHMIQTEWQAVGIEPLSLTIAPTTKGN